LKVLERILEPIAGEKQSESIIRALPGQETATFIFSSAEMKPRVNRIGVRWLLTRHITLTEKDVQKHMSELVKQQQKILQEMERVRLAEKGKKEAERRKLAEQKKKDAEQRRADEEKRKKEEADRRRREKELAEKKVKFQKASDKDKVFSTRGQAGAVSYDDLINGFVAMIEAIAKTAFGLPFLRELVKRGELNHEKALSYYLSETRAAIKQGLAKKEKKEIKKRGKVKKVTYIIYDFEHVLNAVIKSMGVREPDYVDEKRLKKRFEQLVKKASRNSLLDRIVLGEPFLEF